MTVIEHIDPISVVETLLLEIFQKVFQNDTARCHFGYSLISHTATSEGFPLWYLWFSEKKGVYSLAVIEGYVASDAIDMSVHERQNKHIVGARLLARYFPAVNENAFDSLSCFEQIIRMGSDFDSTGTPSFEGGRIINESFFAAGYMDIVIDSSKSDVDFFCSAPNRWRDYRLAGLTLTNDRGETLQVVSPGNLDRDFPGWELSFFIFDKIISSFCFASGQAPQQTGAASKPSFSCEIDAEQRITTVYDSDITESIFGVCFSNGTKECILKERFASLAKRFHSQDYTLIGLWDSPNDIPAKWRRPAWWTIKTRHFHANADHVCSCYEDH